jgi:hypothetical protein
MPDSPLSLGAYGAAVARLHEYLSQQGVKLPASEMDRAFFGPATRQAIQQIQQQNGLPATGQVDDQTARAINFPSAEPSVRGAGSTTTNVSEGSGPTQPGAKDEGRGTVQGKLVDQDGAPIADTRVSLFAKYLRDQGHLGDGVTSKQGQYTISYDRPLALNLVVRAYDASGKAIAESRTVYAAAATVQIDFTTAASGIVRSPSIFATLGSNVAAQLKGTPLDGLKENKDTHELRFLANAIRAQFNDVAYLFIARVLAKQNSLRDATLFGIFRQGIPASLDAALASLPDAGIDSAFVAQALSGVLAHSRASLALALTAAVSANVLPASYASTQDSELDLLDSLRVQSVRSAPFIRGKTPLKDLLEAGSVIAAVQTAFTKAYADNGGQLGPTWKVLRANQNLKPEDLAALKTALQLGDLLSGNLLLVKDTLARLSGKTLSSVQDLARLDQSDWVARLTALDPQATTIPAVLPNETPQQRIARFAKTLAKVFAGRYPTTAFLGGLAKAKTSSFKMKEDLTAFLGANPKFSFTRTNIDQYVGANQVTIKPEALKELKIAQRLFRISPRYAAVDALKSAGYASAQSVYFKGRAPFLAQMTQALGSASLAGRAYAQAQMTYATALMAFGRYHLALNGISVAAMQPPAPDPSTIANLPDLQALFGPLDCFQCEDCQSVLSPAAYLVDLLQYLAQFHASGGGVSNARDALFLRRPDIQYIALDCNNTDVTLPYIDLVNEILEAAIAPPSPPVTFIDTIGTSAERRALPQQISQAAYVKTATNIFPLSLPFDLPFAQTTAYIAALKTTWAAILSLFVFRPTSAGASDATIACAAFGINPEMQAVVDSPDTTHPWTRWGLPQKPSSVIDPKNGTPYSPTPTDWVAALQKVPVLLNRTGLSPQQLYQLLEAVWVTQSGVTLRLGTETYAGVPMVSPDTDAMVFTGLTGDVMDRASRFLRLWTATGLQMWELDWALEHSTGSLPNLDAFLVFLAGAKAVSAQLKLPFQEVLSFWMPLETRDVTNHLGAKDTVVPSTYSEVFRNAAVLASWANVFVPLDQGSLSGNKIIDTSSATPTPEQNAIAAALGLSADNISAVLAFTGAANTLSLDTLNVLLRYQRLASSLSLDVSDLILWIQLTAGTPFNSTPADTLEFLRRLAVLRGTKIGARDLDYLLRNQSASQSSLAFTATQATAVLQTIRDTIAKLPTPAGIPVVSASNTSPIAITTATPHGLQTGMQVAINGVLGNPAANGTFTITVTGPTSFTLNGSVGSGTWAGGGTIVVSNQITSASNASPIAITTAVPHGLQTGALVSINGALGNTAANGTFTITVTGPTSFTLNGSTGNGTWISGGTITVPTYDPATIQTIFLNALATATGVSANVVEAVLLEIGILPLSPGQVSLLLGQTSAVDPTQFPALINAITSIAKAAVLFSALKPTEAEFAFVVKNAGGFGWLDPGALPLASTDQSPYSQFEALLRALKLNRRQTARTPKLFDVLGQWLTRLPPDLTTAIQGSSIAVAGASDTTPITITTATPHGLQTGMQVSITGVGGNTAANGIFTIAVTGQTTFTLNGSSGNGNWTSGGTVIADVTSLALALNASVADVTAIATALNATPPSLTSATQSGTLADVAMLASIANALDVAARYGISGATLVQLSQAPATSDTASAARSVLQAQYSQDKWFPAIQPIEDVLREMRRDALVAYLLGSWATHGTDPAAAPAMLTADDIFDYYLIDPEMTSCAVTTRLLEASLAIQQFVQQCFLNIPSAATVYMSNTQLAAEWSWRQQYRLWEANREVFLYPENYLLPELRKNASPFFLDLMNDLRQTDCNADAAEAAIENYLRKLVNVSRLVVAAHYNQTNSDGSTVLYVFAHTRGTPPQWYYRTRTAAAGATSGVWSAWEQLNLDIASDHLVPVIWDRRLHLVWPVFKQVSEKQADQEVPSSGGGGSSSPPTTFWAVEIAMSELSAGQWQPKRTIAEKIFLNSEDPPLTFSFQSSEDPSFNLWLRVYHNNSTLAVSSSGFPSSVLSRDVSYPAGEIVAEGELEMPEAPLQVREAPGVLPPSNVADLSQEPSFALVTTGGLTAQPSQLATPNQYGFSGQDLVFGGYQDKNPGQVQLNVLRATTAGGQPTSIELLGNITNPHIIIPQSKGIFDSADPFFVADPNRTYLVLPQYSTISSSPQPLITPPSYGQWNTRYVFQTFYHPYARILLRELEIGGVPQLMSRDLQVNPNKKRGWGTTIDFNALYSPQPYVEQPYPGDPGAPDPGESALDFDPACGGAYSLYNWETFYHIPMFMAPLLMQNQKYQDTMTWLKYIFNPTDSTGGPAPQRFWEFAPFNAMNSSAWISQEIQDILTTLAADMQQGISDQATANAINTWMADPFDPHAVASLRIPAYGKATVMKFLDNLIAWGDALFSQYTAETVSQAEQLYIIADMILGPKPTLLRPPSSGSTGANAATYASLQKIDLFSNALATVENLVVAPEPPAWLVQGTAQTPSLPQFPGNGSTLLFCIPPNDQLLAYWDKVSQRLHNIRTCRTLQGVAVPLPLYAPPVSPLLLAEAQAGGVSAPGIPPAPIYRFATYLQKAVELTNDVRAFGALILSALEKQDAESLAGLRANQELDIQTRLLDVKQGQLTEAQDQITALQNQKAVVQIRYNFYANIAFLNAWETAALALQGAALIANGVAIVLDMVSGGAHMVPSFSVGVAGFGGTPTVTMSYGGENVGAATAMWASVARGLAGILSEGGGLAATMGGYQRRMNEWQLQAQLAGAELTQLDSQITAATDRLNVASSELSIQNVQITNAQAVSDFLTSKYTNTQLYNWMAAQLTTVYAQAYQLAFALALQAQNTYQYELGSQDNFIQNSYWDGPHKGLTAGEGLLFDLRRMEAQYLSENARELELTKHVSLALTNPMALVMLREAGTCQIALDEALFDKDHPGQYFRRLRAVALTIPCVTGPYTGVNATLSLTNAAVRTQAPSSPYSPLKAAAAPPVISSPGTAMIATSTGQNDAGLFEVNLRDERWLPFEGQGAISQWTLTLDPRDNNFDFSTITDVVLHIRYTARGGGDPDAANAVRAALQPQNGSILVSVRNTFGDAYYRFFNPADTTTTQQILTLPISSAIFPFSNLGNGTPNVQDITLFIFLTRPIKDNLQTTIGPTSGTPAPSPLLFTPVASQTAAGNPVPALSAQPGTAAIGGNTPQSLTLIVPSANVPPSMATTVSGQMRLDYTKVEDIVLVIDYDYPSS